MPTLPILDPHSKEPQEALKVAAASAPAPALWQSLGPGLITGASDDDPSGIATYAQVGAQLGYNVGWTLILTYPFMCAIQLISAEIGRVTGHGIAGNLRKYYPFWLLNSLIALLVIANTINLGADIGAMGAALNLLIPGPIFLYVVIFAVISAVLQVFVDYSRYVSILKWLTFSLFAYVATVFVVHIPWTKAIADLFVPDIQFSGKYTTAIVAVFGTTISPYLFFWQAGSEVERERAIPGRNALKATPKQGARELKRIKTDTFVGMAFSNLVALAIVWTTAATLHAHGIRDIDTSAQAAEALRPIAGRFAYTLFAFGIIGTGLLAVPVLAGSAAYALGEAMRWPVGLARKPAKAKAFYGTIVALTMVGSLINLSSIDPVKALFWSAVLNGLVAVPIMIMIMFMASNHKIMGKFSIKRWLKIFGWAGTGLMALVAIAMLATWNVQ